MHCRNLCYKHINAYFKHRQASMVNASILHKQTQVLSNGSLKFEITAKRLYAASQRVL